MGIGEKILSLRKGAHITQEELAEKLNVTRQTISKWELEETAPDIKQAKELSRIFHVSLDELVGNDVKDLLVERVSNTEKLAGMIIKIIKIGGAIIFGLFFIELIVLFFFSIGVLVQKNTSHAKVSNIRCTIDGKEYSYQIEHKGNHIIHMAGNSYFEEHINFSKYENPEDLFGAINHHFIENGGSCSRN